jgi:hypothetical protein
MDSCGSSSTRRAAPGKRILFEGAQGAARHRSRHVSLRHLVEHRGGPGRDGFRPRPRRHRIRARHRQGLYDARRRRAVPDRAGRRDRRAHRRARARVRHRDGAQAPLRLVRRGARAPDRQARRGIDGIALTKLDVLDGFEEIKVCTGYASTARSPSTGCRPARTRRRASSRSTGRSRAGQGSTAGRALMGRPAGAGGQVRAPHRGAYRVPGGAALDQPRARRHDPDEGSVRGLAWSEFGIGPGGLSGMTPSMQRRVIPAKRASASASRDLRGARFRIGPDGPSGMTRGGSIAALRISN